MCFVSVVSKSCLFCWLLNEAELFPANLIVLKKGYFVFIFSIIELSPVGKKKSRKFQNGHRSLKLNFYDWPGELQARKLTEGITQIKENYYTMKILIWIPQTQNKIQWWNKIHEQFCRVILLTKLELLTLQMVN